MCGKGVFQHTEQLTSCTVDRIENNVHCSTRHASHRKRVNCKEKEKKTENLRRISVSENVPGFHQLKLINNE